MSTFQNPNLYEFDKTNPHMRHAMPDEPFVGIYQKIQMYAVGLMSQLDPSRAEEYKTLPLKYHAQLEDSVFKGSIQDFFAGCFDSESAIFKNSFRSSVGKVQSYLRFLYEKDTCKEELDKITIKNPLFIVALPRSGSTFTHAVLSQDPNANCIALYEHLSPGSKTMCREGRLAFANKIVNPVINEKDQFNKVHALDDVKKAEEEIFFMEMLGHTLIYSSCLPRLEQYRENIFKRSYQFMYDAMIEEFKMHIMDLGMTEKQHLCLKAVSHFLNPGDFLDMVRKTEGRVVWIHREPIAELKSVITGYFRIRGNFPDDLGFDDVKWLNENVIRMNTLCLKNSIAARDAWVKEDPKREKQIYDLAFSSMTKDPIGETKKIYEYFGMEYTPEFEQNIKNMVHPQESFGKIVSDDDKIVFDKEDVRKRYMFYYERFKEYLPNYFN
ncbi:hypothetical protein EIN_032120 [Entamoeba invadens IP1]|uniref:Sulfotransferase n=1 Tax=Entamoeba invadens IP1 TaxID=370355 RepID=A0A0A1U448_ENTIV|nr:hypothetical protein EIN_032120 [Entamoeba invadens IP1]ELP86461.1 hypothetical protein EIN_032120 [Entamoeba invadens IP1]|eukprot:XP_004185807.1 hypothetical protein EIN_032120 [Entamoeba invadens IP1]